MKKKKIQTPGQGINDIAVSPIRKLNDVKSIKNYWLTIPGICCYSLWGSTTACELVIFWSVRRTR